MKDFFKAGDTALIARTNGSLDLTRFEPEDGEGLADPVQVRGYLLLASIYQMIARKDPEFQTMLAKEIDKFTKEAMAKE